MLFEGYSVFFTIKDIDKALSLLAEIGDTSFGSACGLDTSGNYYTELYSGSKMEYHNKLQLLLQNAVGCFLLSKGHATVERTRHKQLKVIIMDIMAPVATQDEEYLLFYDPHSGKRIFSGKMLQEMFDKDLGID